MWETLKRDVDVKHPTQNTPVIQNRKKRFPKLYNITHCRCGLFEHVFNETVYIWVYVNFTVPVRKLNLNAKVNGFMSLLRRSKFKFPFTQTNTERTCRVLRIVEQQKPKIKTKKRQNNNKMLRSYSLVDLKIQKALF